MCPPGQICVRTETFLQGGAVGEICCDCVTPPPDGSCCDANGICIPEPAGGCPPGTTFHPGPCQPIQGCCFPSGVCVDLEPRCCVDQGGTVTPNPCAGVILGCCFSDGTCANLDRECCLLQGGMPQSTTCQPDEACCYDPPFAPLCIDTDPQCCQLSGGTPQGAGTSCLGDGDGDGVDDACQDPPPGICPLPNSPQAVFCESFQLLDCMETPGVTGEECLPFDFLVEDAGLDPIARCKCQFPDACGPVNFVGTVYSCPGACPPGTEPCQIYINGNPTGLGSIDESSPLLEPGFNVTCGCE